MIPRVNLDKMPNSAVLNALRDALFEHADNIRRDEECYVRAGIHNGWTSEGVDRYRAFIAAGAVLEHVIASGVDATVSKRAAPEWVAKLAGQARGALSRPLPAPTAVAPLGEADDAA